MSNIKIYGRLENATTDNLLAGTSQIFDDDLNKFQSLINLEVIFKTEKGEASGVATLNSSGKIPSELLPSYVDDVIEYDLKDSFPNPGEEGKIYVAKDNNKSYRWSGSLYILVGTPLELGETSTTAYFGDKGKATTDKINSHVDNTSNPHGVTKAQVGLGSVDNTADSTKPVSTALREAINTAKTEAITTVGNYTINGKKINTNPTLVKSDVGLSNVNNTSDLDKPVSTATQSAIDSAKLASDESLLTHIEDVDNPHLVTKAQVGLSNVDNTSDANKPISTAQSQALNEKVDKVEGKSLVSDSDITKLSGLKLLTELDTSIADAKKAGTDALTSINTHIEDLNNPHNVTKELVGLSNVDNTADTDKPISTAVLNALDNKADISELNNKITSNIVASVITLTKAEYQNLEVKDDRTIYLIIDSVLTLENGALILVE